MMFLRTLFLLALVTAAACSPSAQPVAIPSAAHIVEISITTKADRGSSRLIKDRVVIERVINLVTEESHALTDTFFTFPTPAASAALRAQEYSAPLVIWFGTDWLGLALTVDGKRRNVFWHPQPGTEFELRRLLEIAP